MEISQEEYAKLEMTFRSKHPQFDKVWLTGSMNNKKEDEDKTCQTHLHVFDSSNGMRFTESIESDRNGHFPGDIYEKLYSRLDKMISEHE